MGHQRAEDLHHRCPNNQYIFLITRTDPTLPKHKGLTMFLVPLDTPGIEVHALPTVGDERTNITYYSDVRISDRYRIGEVNNGWSVLHGPLDTEHSLDDRASKLEDWARAQLSCITSRSRSRPPCAGRWTLRTAMGR